MHSIFRVHEIDLIWNLFKTTIFKAHFPYIAKLESFLPFRACINCCTETVFCIGVQALGRFPPQNLAIISTLIIKDSNAKPTGIIHTAEGGFCGGKCLVWVQTRSNNFTSVTCLEH